MATKMQMFTGVPQASSSSSNSLYMIRKPLTTSFLSDRVELLKVEGIRIAGQRGGALGAHMNLFDKFAKVVKSYSNATISSFEDPEKILEQKFLEINEDLTKMFQATAQVLESQKRLENNYKSTQEASLKWYFRAELASLKDDEDLKREALKWHKSYEDNATALKAQLELQKGVVENLVSNILFLEMKIHEARFKTDAVKAKAQSAKIATKIDEMLGNLNKSVALSASGMIEEKVLAAMELQTEALGQLTSDYLEGKFALLESSSVDDDDLANLKKERFSGSKKGDLPPGRSATSSKKPRLPFLERDGVEEWSFYKWLKYEV